jgi:SAM-dependent methyltransferase
MDACISIAVLHHISTLTRRRQAVRELIRIVRPGGKILICVWAYEQASRQFAAQDVLVPLYLRHDVHGMQSYELHIQ